MLRDKSTPDERALDVTHFIDPGFVNHRLVETIVGARGAQVINDLIARLPDSPECVRRTRIDHVYTRVALGFCTAKSIPPLRTLLAQGSGSLFCSTEQIGPVPSVYDAQRIEAPIILQGYSDCLVALAFGTDHISSDTLRMRLASGAQLSIIASMPRMEKGVLVFEPLVIGAPWLEIDDPQWTDIIIWHGLEFYENYLEDFDEFSKVKDLPLPTQGDAAVMQHISEKAFKNCLAEILGDRAVADWGGEISDHYTAHIHLRGRPQTGAFLLKGPAKYGPMSLNQLGKNNDQIYRLAQSPADVLFVQHCHEITPPVRATLRAFAVQPSRPRRYCLIDGRDSLRLLQAYGKLDKARAAG